MTEPHVDRRAEPPERCALVVIPARMASTRLPGKPLQVAGGKPLVQHVWERAQRIRTAAAVLIATDDVRIAEAVDGFGGLVVMTSAAHESGTDRVAEAARDRSEPIVVNLQGDEPEFDPDEVDALVLRLLADASLPMGTLAAVTEDLSELEAPSVVKVVCDLGGRALYFSRAQVPFDRDGARVRGGSGRSDQSGGSGSGGGSGKDEGFGRGGGRPSPVLRHVGIYAFRREALQRFAALTPTPLERTECLEQLRALEHGWPIAVVPARRASPGIDTQQDLDAFRRRLLAETESQEA